MPYSPTNLQPNVPPPQFTLPGIGPGYCLQAQLRHVDAVEASGLCGIQAAGLWIPYQQLDGSPVLDGGKPYGRLRLSAPMPGKKYHQAAGSAQHGYIPPWMDLMPKGADLCVVEGEKKALALVEAGCWAVGIGGFFGFADRVEGEDRFEFVPELAQVIAEKRPGRILFIGDSDTSLNFEFSRAAIRMAHLSPCPVLLPRIPLACPKGVDDCRGEMGEEFGEWWAKRIESAVPVARGAKVERLAIKLFRPEIKTLPDLSDKDALEDRLATFGASMWKYPQLREQVTEAAKSIGFTKTSFRESMKMAAKRGQEDAVPQQLEAYYDDGRKVYWLRDSRERFIEVTERALLLHLVESGFARDAGEDAQLSPAEQQLLSIQKHSNVNYAGPLAGFDAGLHLMCGNLVLVTRSPRIPDAAPGDWPTIRAVLEGLFADPDWPELDQLSHFYGWLKLGYESIRDRVFRQAQAIALCGPRGAGKSLLQDIITESLGGRVAKPGRYMLGATDFNADLFAAEHLAVEDECSSTDIRSRRNFGTRIKEITVNKVQSCHGKGRNAVALEPFWRLSISVNDEPENLMILPPLDESIGDKVMIFRVSKAAMPMPTGTAEEREAFRGTLSRELPGFLHWLTQWTIPDEISCQRFGVKEIHHPDILEALTEAEPQTRLMGLIDTLMDESEASGAFQGTAAELERRLVASEKTNYEAKRLLNWANACGTYLGRLAIKFPNRIWKKKSDPTSSHIWTIQPKDWVSDSENSFSQNEY